MFFKLLTSIAAIAATCHGSQSQIRLVYSQASGGGVAPYTELAQVSSQATHDEIVNTNSSIGQLSKTQR